MGTNGSNALVALIADDFGLCPEVNRAIVAAHRQGVLTGASLMVTGGSFAEAVEMARDAPALAVGLHLVLVDGRPASAPGRVPRLVDLRGRFPRSPVRAGLRCMRANAVGQLEREMRAQFERFAETGLPLRHVDGHLHLHLHPTALEPLIRLAREYGAPRIRVPRDDFILSCRCDPHQCGRKLLRWLVLKPVIRRAWRRVREEGFLVTDRCYGLLQSGRMSTEYVVAALGQVSRPAELFFHPTVGRRLDPLGPNRGDLQVLLSPAVRAAVGQAASRLGGEKGPIVRSVTATCLKSF